MTEYTVVMVGVALSADCVLNELAMRRDMELCLAKFIYDAKRDIYSKCRGERTTIKVYPDQYLGIFSADGRVEMFSARVREVEKKTAEYFPDIKVGARICICFDSLIEAGCIHSVKNGNSETHYAISGYLRGHDFDGDPVEPLSDADMQTTIARMTENEAESETTVQVVSEAAEAESETEIETVQTGSGGVLSQDEFNTRTSDMEASNPVQSQPAESATVVSQQTAGQAAGNVSPVAPAGQQKAKRF